MRRKKQGLRDGTITRVQKAGAELHVYHVKETTTMLMSNPPKERIRESHWRDVYATVDGKMTFLRRDKPEKKTRNVESSETYLEWPDKKEPFIPAY